MDQFRHFARAPVRVPARLAEGRAPRPAAEFDSDSLTDKEEKVLEHISEGMSNRQIANAMSLAEGTVKNYVSRIMEKLHANTRTELAIMTHRQAGPAATR
jgi:DNA-binding NarL/FixJ family response regulator